MRVRPRKREVCREEKVYILSRVLIRVRVRVRVRVRTRVRVRLGLGLR